MTFQENLKAYRKINKLSQERLAERLGVSRQSVSKWETGEAYPEMNNILALCTIFHCKVSELIDDRLDLDNFDSTTRQDIISLEKRDEVRFKKLAKFFCILAKCAKYLSLLNFVVIAAVTYLLHWAVFNFLFAGAPDGATFDDLNFFTFFAWGAFAKSILVLVVIAIYVVASIFIFKLFAELEKLFQRIHDNASPFSLENVDSLKKIAKFVCLGSLLPNLSALIGRIFIPTIPFRLNLAGLILPLLIAILVYIFRYGVLLQTRE